MSPGSGGAIAGPGLGASGSPDPREALRRHFGYPGFRPGQEELVRGVLAGRDALGILPTGGGKSVCYQVPALCLPGLTMVVSPLISLMADQVDRCREAGIAAEYLNSSLGATERRAVVRRVREGGVRMLFVAPERLLTSGFRALLARSEVSLMAVDEAHCISSWGHDFRPSYLKLGEVRRSLGVPAMALTATATPRVRREIVASLGLHDPVRVVKSFDRPNLSWWVVPIDSPRLRAPVIHRLVRRVPGAALVYGSSRKGVEGMRDELAARGVSTEAYHAGLPAPERERVQQRFMEDDRPVVVATNAFGMGIDRADVRLVIHMELPGSLEGYYQEAGRAGRDGEPARCVALRAPGDGRIQMGFVDRTHPPPAVVRRMWRRLRREADASGRVRLSPSSAASAAGKGTDEEGGLAALRALARSGSLRVPEGVVEHGAAGGSRRKVEEEFEVEFLRRRPHLAGLEELRRRELARLAAVGRYARSRSCRRRVILRYFGEEAPDGGCGGCDRCRQAGRTFSD